MKCPNCGRHHGTNQPETRTCKCGVRLFVSKASPRPFQGFRRHLQTCAQICKSNECGHWITDKHHRDGCELQPGKPCDIEKHLLNGGGCHTSPQHFPHIVDTVRAKSCQEVTQTQIVTIHYNPLRNRRQRETYYEWMPTLGELAKYLKCYELVFDDDEPEIHGSVVIRGTRERNLMWQKEALLNLALSQCPPEIEYFAWLDHDMVILEEDWLKIAIKKIQEGAVACQLFKEIRYLDINRIQTHNLPGRAATGDGNPGGMWLGNRRYLDAIGGFHNAHIVGGGDQWVYAAMTGTLENYFKWAGANLSPKSRASIQQYYDQAKRHGKGVASLNSPVCHLYHGTLKNKQYKTRDLILKRANFDPDKDIRINEDGILEWASDKPNLRREVRAYFENRREDD